jgi:hypothetical protein
MIFTNDLETARFPQNIPGERGTNSHNSNEKEPGAGSNQALHAQTARVIS